MTQLSNVLITDNSMYYQNKLSVIKTSDNCVFAMADLRANSIQRKREPRKKVQNEWKTRNIKKLKLRSFGKQLYKGMAKRSFW